MDSFGTAACCARIIRTIRMASQRITHARHFSVFPGNGSQCASASALRTLHPASLHLGCALSWRACLASNRPLERPVPPRSGDVMSRETDASDGDVLIRDVSLRGMERGTSSAENCSSGAGQTEGDSNGGREEESVPEGSRASSSSSSSASSARGVRSTIEAPQNHALRQSRSFGGSSCTASAGAPLQSTSALRRMPQRGTSSSSSSTDCGVPDMSWVVRIPSPNTAPAPRGGRTPAPTRHAPPIAPAQTKGVEFSNVFFFAEDFIQRFKFSVFDVEWLGDEHSSASRMAQGRSMAFCLLNNFNQEAVFVRWESSHGWVAQKSLGKDLLVLLLKAGDTAKTASLQVPYKQQLLVSSLTHSYDVHLDTALGEHLGAVEKGEAHGGHTSSITPSEAQDGAARDRCSASAAPAGAAGAAAPAGPAGPAGNADASGRYLGCPISADVIADLLTQHVSPVVEQLHTKSILKDVKGGKVPMTQLPLLKWRDVCGKPALVIDLTFQGGLPVTKSGLSGPMLLHAVVSTPYGQVCDVIGFEGELGGQGGVLREKLLSLRPVRKTVEAIDRAPADEAVYAVRRLGCHKKFLYIASQLTLVPHPRNQALLPGKALLDQNVRDAARISPGLRWREIQSISSTLTSGRAAGQASLVTPSTPSTQVNPQNPTIPITIAAPCILAEPVSMATMPQAWGVVDLRGQKRVYGGGRSTPLDAGALDQLAALSSGGPYALNPANPGPVKLGVLLILEQSRGTAASYGGTPSMAGEESLWEKKAVRVGEVVVATLRSMKVADEEPFARTVLTAPLKALRDGSFMEELVAAVVSMTSEKGVGFVLCIAQMPDTSEAGVILRDMFKKAAISHNPEQARPRRRGRPSKRSTSAAASEGFALKLLAPNQMVYGTAVERFEGGEKVQKLIVCNIVYGVCSKLGHIPYVLHPGLPFLDHVFGIDIGRNEAAPPGVKDQVSIITHSTANGQLKSFTPACFDGDGETVPEEVLQQGLRGEELQGKRIVVVRHGPLRGSEKGVIQSILGAENVTFVEVIERGAVRFFGRSPRDGQVGHCPVDRFLREGPNKWVLSASMPYTGSAQPITVRLQENPLGLSEQQALVLVAASRRLNLNSFSSSKLPAFLHLADRAAHAAMELGLKTGAHMDPSILLQVML